MEKKKVIIIGGGVTGLAAAWYLRGRFDLLLFEKEQRLGGWIQTEKKGGFLFEKGPRSLRPGMALELAAELGLENEIIYADKAARKRFLYAGGKLKNASSFLWRALPGLMTEWMREKSRGDESVKTFISRRFGRYAAEMLMDPLISGIYAGDSELLSFKSCFPGLYEMEQKYGSITKGLLFRSKSSAKGIYTFKNGLETLVRALEENVSAKIHLSTPAQKIAVYKDHIRVLANGLWWRADHVILALPQRQLSRLMDEHDPELARLLNEIQSVSVAVVNVGYKEPVLSLKGFGYLIPSQEKEPVLGVVWDSSAFPQQNSSPQETRLTVMIGGVRMGNGSKDFIGIALKALDKHLGIKRLPDFAACRLAKKAIPQYTVGHDERLYKIKKRLSTLTGRIHFLGNSFCGVSVNDCIAGAESLSNSLF